MKKPIAVSGGDPGGIAAEVICKANRKWREEINSSNGNLDTVFFVVVCHGAVLEASGLTENDSYHVDDVKELADYEYLSKIAKKKLIYMEPPVKMPGFDKNKASSRNGFLAFNYLKFATSLVIDNWCKALVTAPINKYAITIAEIDDVYMKKALDHTNYLKARDSKFDCTMLFWHREIKLALLTIHHPISEVCSLINKEMIYFKLQQIYQFVKLNGVEQPRICILGLNPHSGENGLMGDEEIKYFHPAINDFRANFPEASICGPISADAAFKEQNRKNFDVVIACYHDQGLPAFKALYENASVNVTVGLSFIRTSVDHGTAYDIAYQNKADPGSMILALQLATKLKTPK